MPARNHSIIHATLVLSLIAGTNIAFTQPADPTPAATPAATEPAKPDAPRPESAPAAPATTPAPVAPVVDAKAVAAEKKPEPKPVELDANGRRKNLGENITLSFPKATVEQIVPFIVEVTGKVVIPQQEVLARRITVLNDKPIPRAQALDLIFLALQQTGVAVIEKDDLILLRDQGDMDRQALPVVGADVSVLKRTDLGSIVQKIFKLRTASATNVGDLIKPMLPDPNKQLAVDPDSNQIVVIGPIVMLKRIEEIVVALDQPKAEQQITRTFHLQFGDAEQIAQNIRDLYVNNTGTGRQLNQTNAVQLRNLIQGGGNNAQGGQRAQGQGGGVTTPQIRVTSNTQQNAVSVVAEKDVIDTIAKQIENEWDKPVAREATAPKVYQLQYTDPVKVRTMLEGLYGQTNNSRQTGSRLSGQFTFQAQPEAGRLIVVARNKDQLGAIDAIIAEVDKPVGSGLPEIIELNHAQAEDIAEQVNALLAQEGTLAALKRSSSTLSSSNAAQSPFASNANTSSSSGTDTNAFARETPTDTLTFWWQRARVPTDSFGASNIVGKARIVPVARQNAVMVMAQLEYKKAISDLIKTLDRPGRQVMISAVIVEMTGEDATALGVRFSNSAITPSKQDGTISLSGQSPTGTPTAVVQGQQNNLIGSLFNTSVLNVGMDVNVLLQALSSKTSVKILSEPRIFTGDNVEAAFFDGQDIPFITNTQTPTGTNTNVVNSFDYKAVGISLRVRPRITPDRDVDLKVNLQLASINPTVTSFGSFIIDRRETTTQTIVSDGQTIVISGIMRSEDQDVKRKIPGLGDIPLLGELFTQREKSKTNTELVAFITPIVVNNREESGKFNEPYRDRLGELRKGTPTEKLPPLTPVRIAPPADEPGTN